MKLLGRTLVVLPVWAALTGLTNDQCATAAAAHERFLESSFEVERLFEMSVNGNLKKREVARLVYSGGELAVEVIEDQVLSKGLVFEGEGKDFALETSFSCERIEADGDGHFDLASEDGLEVVEFVLDENSRALRPVSWRLDTIERFLFKKFVIEGRVQYSNFEWSEATDPLSE